MEQLKSKQSIILSAAVIALAIIVIVLLVLAYILMSHFIAMRSIKKWDLVETVKDRE